MRKIRILSKKLDKMINSPKKGKKDFKFFFKCVQDKEKLKSIRIGGYCSDETLQAMFKEYGIQ
jgi:hypothetical protein